MSTPTASIHQTPAAGRLPRELPYGSHPSQEVLFWPAPEANGKALVAFFHGGAWREGSAHSLTHVGEWLAREGHPAALVGYRLAPDHCHPAQLEDAASAVRWLCAHEEQLGLVGRPLVVAGHSAGGHLAAMLVFDQRWLGPDLAPAGLVGLSGVYDLEAMAKRRWMREQLLDANFPADADILRAASPLTHIRAVAARIWLGNAEMDWGLYRHTAAMVDALADVGQAVETWTAAGRHHLNQMESLGQPDDPTTTELTRFLASLTDA